jgi:cob(I)alamin adenosyltransferase
MGKIYTKTGDEGTAGTLLWGRRSKGEGLFDLIGTLDELNCCLGLAASLAAHETIEPLQNDVFEIGYWFMSQTPFDPQGERLAALEREIDRLEAANPPLSRFILPGGGTPAAMVHLARAVCRRAERELVRQQAPPPVLAYVNRLSDLLFVLARHVNAASGQAERHWQH